jgi:hypothetical protein
MTQIHGVQRAGRWRVFVRDVPCIPSETVSRARVDGRAAVWRAAKALTVHSSPWELEYFKACLGEPEIILGLAERLAADCSSRSIDGCAQCEAVLCAPSRYFNLRTAVRAFGRRGLVVEGMRWQTLLDQARFILASTGAAVALLAYIIRYSYRNSRPAVRDGLLLAVHAEWSNRTRHVLTQLVEDFPADAIILLGRVRRHPDHVVKDWSDKLGIDLPPVFVPISAGSALRSIPKMLVLLRHGLRLSSQQPYLPGLRDRAAIAFRVLLGAVMQQWWNDTGFRGGKIVYGHTGTADTSMLEKAQQDAGAKSIHVVHGVATGPNFLGYSDVAVFRCGLDARLYRDLQQYGRCIAPSAPKPAIGRGNCGILLLTNYAHPLNPGYIARGLADELRVLRDVAAIAGEFAPQSTPLSWKPHPMMSTLPQSEQNQLKEEAGSLGYALIPPNASLRDTAAQARWTLVTPSTVALDLLIDGYLCIVLNWQASDPDAATSMFPTRVTDPAELRDMLNQLAMDDVYHERFDAAWSRLAPAQALNLAVVLEGLD